MNQITMKKAIGNTALLMTAVIWGSAFVAQRVGMDYVGPLTFTGTRFWLAAAVLIPVVYFSDKAEKKAGKQARDAACDLPGSQVSEAPSADPLKARKTFLLAGVVCGSILFLASILQQYGLVFTTAGKAGFITALYILLVPIFGLFLKQRSGIKVWVGVAFGTAGLYLLTITESLTIAWGDFVVLIGAFFWASHVLAIDHFLPHVNGVKLALMQFSVCAFWGTIGMLLFETPSMEAVLSGAVPILYAGVMSGGIGFTLQIIGQRYTSPAVASLLLSMEAVFGAVFGYLILHEVMTTRELLGCLLMFAAIIISQLPQKIRMKQEAAK